ncbi:hypothetical protein AUC70_11875 [Methyloceanibacter stevinii]|uniref:ParB-like N-terminal domain-containing protein n=1 Tax=Methyloceanibacter stevinii TaxID=1774970 RepID=A0A1E3VJ63_9HYPH|nr:ParB N-terminal domain-containing protein [Methyloceanibacter stevinii]ODR93554.1 hypothetical protein AUC70_11875 [Methyloceanibacter stevinii]
MKFVEQREVPVADIVVGNRLREIDEEWVAALAAMIKVEGQQSAIGVRDLGDGTYKLTAGEHRLEAAKKNGMPTIRADIFVAETESPADEERVQEILENVGRRELSALDRASNLAELKAVYERLYPQTKRGVAGGKARQNAANDILSFADSASEKTGLSARQIQRAVQVHNGLTADARSLVRGLPIADNESQLRALAALDKPLQSRVAKLLQQGEAANVAGARAILDGTAKQPSQKTKALETLVKAWERAPADVKKRFLKRINATLVKEG